MAMQNAWSPFPLTYACDDTSAKARRVANHCGHCADFFTIGPPWAPHFPLNWGGKLKGKGGSHALSHFPARRGHHGFDGFLLFPPAEGRCFPERRSPRGAGAARGVSDRRVSAAARRAIPRRVCVGAA